MAPSRAPAPQGYRAPVGTGTPGPSTSQKSVVLILARQLASNIATPMLVLDRRGTLVYFNEPAEAVFGTRFDEVGEVPAEVWDQRWPVTDADGTPISLLASPLAAVIFERTPGHASIRVTGLDGQTRPVEATVFPLFDSGHQFVGAVGVFWQPDDASSEGDGAEGAP